MADKKIVIEQSKCKNCGGQLRFHPETGKLACEFCNSVFDIDDSNEALALKAEQVVEGFDYQQLINQVTSDDAEALPVYSCTSCGAEILAADEEFALTCPYCGSHVVLTEKVSGKLRPDGIVPFEITPETLPEAVRKFYHNRRFLPKSFFSDNKMGKVTGIYVPFWVFNGTVSGTLIYSGEKTDSVRRQGDYLVSTIEVYRLERSVSMEFADLPVDAGEKLEDALMDSVEPFDLSKMKPYNSAYLAGFAADRFDVPAEDLTARAEKRMLTTACDLSKRTATKGYHSVASLGGHLKAKLDAKYVLLPIYRFDLRYRKKNYSFAVNGQTGKVIGHLPYDNRMKLPYFLVRFGIAAAALVLVFVILYFMGW